MPWRFAVDTRAFCLGPFHFSTVRKIINLRGSSQGTESNDPLMAFRRERELRHKRVFGFGQLIKNGLTGPFSSPPLPSSPTTIRDWPSRSTQLFLAILSLFCLRPPFSPSCSFLYLFRPSPSSPTCAKGLRNIALSPTSFFRRSSPPLGRRFFLPFSWN